MTLPFWRQAGRIINSGQARVLILTGSIYDLYHSDSSGAAGRVPDGLDASGASRGEYLPLIEFLTATWSVPGIIPVVYELNGPIRFARPEDQAKVKDAWLRWRTGYDSNQLAIQQMLAAKKMQAELDLLSDSFESNLQKAIGRPTVALETLRQMCLCSRAEIDGRPILTENLLILIEAADMLIPESPIANMNDADRHRVSVCHDWFSDPGFNDGDDAVIMVAESRSQINSRVSRLPMALHIDIPAPDDAARGQFIEWFDARQAPDAKLETWGPREDLVRFSAGLSLRALEQLLKGAAYEKRRLELDDVVAKVEEFIRAQLGDDIVEFKKPTHGLDDLIGFTNLKTFLREELIPRFRSSGADALPGAAVGGPIGGGKTFIFEAVAGELDMVVLVLKNIRSQWYGQTDVIFERLRRTLEALTKVVIFLDEADTQLGGVGSGTHDTERRLTGKIQSMMSDPALRGRVIWLLMTARIHLLSPDIRRPGRVGDLIIPVLDPVGEDRREFLRWMTAGALDHEPTDEDLARIDQAMPAAFSASYASLRSELKARVIAKGRKLTTEETLEEIGDHLPPAIAETRRYQTLQALVNCTRRGLLPNPKVDESQRSEWQHEIRQLEARGVE